MLALIPLLPFVGFLVNAFLGRRLPKAASGSLATGLMAQSQAMIFDLKKLLVERQQVRRLSAGRGPQLTPSVRQKFFLMVGHLGI